MSLQIELVSPEQKLFSGEGTAVLCRTTEGDIQFLQDHAAFIGLLGIGVVKITTLEGRDELAAIRGGFVEVSNNRVTVLSDLAVLGNQVDPSKVESELQAVKADDEADSEARQDAQRWAKAQLEAANPSA